MDHGYENVAYLHSDLLLNKEGEGLLLFSYLRTLIEGNFKD